MTAGLSVVEASIGELRQALESGRVTSVELTRRYLDRIATYDHAGIRLNAVPVLNPAALADAAASDRRRARGETLGPFDGIPYTAKDSYKARGLSVAAGSPAFADLIATDDAFVISRLRAAGAVLLGLTTMPPMANGGMQRGLYGRAESPYNAQFLTSAFGSGSSNGSGTATAASFCAFGLAEETWSSGRAPAANNGLVAYTPSRGVISVRGNWPLVPTMDVVVPHTRSVADLLELLNVIVADDPDTTGDLWRTQDAVRIPSASSVRPRDYTALRVGASVAGMRFAVPRMYIGGGQDSANPIHTRESFLELFAGLRSRLEAEGAVVIDTDFPIVENEEELYPHSRSAVSRGLLPAEFDERELWDLSIWAWDTFLRVNAQEGLDRLALVDGSQIFPQPEGALPDRYGRYDFDISAYPARAAAGVSAWNEIPSIGEGMRGLETVRRIDFEQWMDDLGVDAVLFPTVADIGPADSDVNPESADKAWANGVWVANGNLVPRRYGIPMVQLPMGLASDIGMPAGVTVAGRAYDDSRLLRTAAALEALCPGRMVPPRTPALPGDE
ncbi:MAG TPA: amidase [Pseudoclavibacter sp.]|nr:amidase [Pseudoclavibacter sp.]